MLTTETPEQMVAGIRAAAGDGEDELAVQPLRDPQVEDLRQTAQRLETQKQYADAAKSLDQALAIVADDPALLQERAEIAVLQKDFPGAEPAGRARLRTRFEGRPAVPPPLGDDRTGAPGARRRVRRGQGEGADRRMQGRGAESVLELISNPRRVRHLPPFRAQREGEGWGGVCFWSGKAKKRRSNATPSQPPPAPRARGGAELATFPPAWE